ncbi:MAG: hypothetical protein M1840_004153 [Geoglossum simile]|nr:MAG: hypothetical protein M1840_004153 [Geoglossum simile]
MRPVEIEVYKERQTIPFSILDRTPQYIRPGASSYWNYMTLEAYRIYEKIHGLCVSRNSTSGMVHVSSFLQQIARSPSPTRIEAIEAWARLLRPEQRSGNLILNSQHPKAFVMAVLYMLHVEVCFKSVRPRLSNGEIGIDMGRREVLKRFTKERVGAAILCRSRGDVGGSRTKGHDINKAILRAAYIAAGGLLHWPDANAREVLPLRMYLAA